MRDIFPVPYDTTETPVSRKIRGFHGGGYEECRPLGCDTVWSLQEPTFRRNVSPPSNKKKQTPWPLVRERTIPTERLPLVGEV
jgi:hypothetical protein